MCTCLSIAKQRAAFFPRLSPSSIKCNVRFTGPETRIWTLGTQQHKQLCYSEFHKGMHRHSSRTQPSRRTAFLRYTQLAVAPGTRRSFVSHKQDAAFRLAQIMFLGLDGCRYGNGTHLKPLRQ